MVEGSEMRTTILIAAGVLAFLVLWPLAIVALLRYCEWLAEVI